MFVPAGESPKRPLAAIFGCSAQTLTPSERSFFRDMNPLGFILFARNISDPDQVRRLVDALRDCTGHADAPVLIDQEGGRVARLQPPHWRAAPPAGVFAALYKTDPKRALEAARLNARLIAAELDALGIGIDCAPVLDLPQAGADPIIGDRAAGTDVVQASALGRAVCEGFLAGNVLPILKHIPGHGRALVDSHKKLPVVDAPRRDLEELDFAPFKALADMPWAMTAHVVYSAIDPALPATLSAAVIETVIRGHIGFDGVLVSDDIGMQALSGDMAARAAGAQAAGCDVVLHCSGNMDEMKATAGALRPLTAAAAERLRRAEAMRCGAQPFDRAAALAKLADLREGG